MPTYRYIFLLLLSLCMQPRHAGAQANNIRFTSLGFKDGLLSNSVNAILKDRYGLMWFATDDGLNKYDGTNFTVYRYQPDNNFSLRSNEILSLHEDKAGNLWIGTSGGGLSRYNRQQDAFVNYPLKPGAITVTGNDVIRGICSDASGKIWLAQYQGLYVLNPATEEISKQVLRDEAGRPVNTTLIGNYIDSKQRLWVITEAGLFVHDLASNSFKLYEHSSQDAASLPDNRARALTEDKWGNIWVGTAKGLSRLNADGSGFTNYPVTSSEIYCLASDNEGRLWIGTANGLYTYDMASNASTFYTHEHNDAQSLTSKWIRCAYVDGQGIYWFGTFRGGVSKYDKNLNLFAYKANSSFQNPAGLAFISALAEAKNGHVLVATDGNGLYDFDPRQQSIHQVQFNLNGTPVSSLSILAMHHSADNRLYFGTYGNGLFVQEQSTGNTVQLKAGKGSNNLTGNDIYSIAEDRKGNVWIGTNGNGINVFNKGKVIAKYVPQPKNDDEALLPFNGYIRAIAEDAYGNMWIGSHGGGVAVFQPASKKWTIYNQENSGLLSNKIQCLYRDSKGRMWIGTFGGGFALFDERTHRFVSFTELQGLQNTMIYQLVEDRQGTLWLSTNTGICSFEPESRRFRNFNSQNGLQTSNYVRGAGLRLADGQLIFGGLEGLNYFYPDKLTRNNNVPDVMLTDLKLYNRSVTAGKASPINDHISIASQIRLDYRQNFSLHFVALNYTIPGQSSYAYLLEGFDRDWNYAGTVTTASYTNLDPGEYTFHVKASNNDGIWSAKDTTIKIFVKPPFWRTTTAYVSYIVLIAGLLLFSRYRSLSRLRRKFAIEQQRQQTARAQELDRLKLKFLTNLSHDFRTPISLIMGPVDQLIVEETSKGKLDKLTMIRRNARRLLNLVNQLLDFRKMEEHELHLHTTGGEFISFLREVTESFRDMSERKSITFSFKTCIDRLDASFDRDKIERILFNLLSNAFKFTLPGGSIIVDLQKAEHAAEQDRTWVTIKVTDTGIGIPQEQRELVFDRFFQHDGAPSIVSQGTGIGLAVTKEFVRIHGGEISVESAAGKGCTFTIQLPLQRAEQLPIEVTVAAAAAVDEDSAIAGAPAIVTVPESNLPAVLLVEDNEDFRFYLKDNLRNDYAVAEAANGKEGWQKTLSHHPQLIVSDISMPEMDGISLVKKLKADKRTSHIPVILLTAMEGPGHQITGLETGATDYITKPFNFEILHAKIKNLLRLKSTMQHTYARQISVAAPEVKMQSAEEKLLYEIVDYLEKNIANPQLSVETLSKHVGMSRSTLYARLLELTGETPVEYIRSFRLNKAKALMEQTTLTIAEIAYEAGFTTPNYFARSFKSKFNMAPSEYIAKARK